MRRPGLFTAAVVAACALLGSVRAAETTHLEDEAGQIEIDAPGTWRRTDSKDAIAASGFLLGIKRAELRARVFADVKETDEAAARWKAARSAESPKVQYTHREGDPVRWTAHDAEKRTLDYARALAGAGRTAVVWVRVNGEPGPADSEAWALLDAARLGKSAGAAGSTRPAVAETRVFKDRDFAIEVTLPAGFAERKDVDPPRERLVLSAKGPVGEDPEAILDVYAFPDSDRADAAGWWWVEAERRGWPDQGVKVQGEPPAFLVLPNGETWNRHVRVLATKAGVYGLKLDVESRADKAADALLDLLVEGKSLAVLKPRPEKPVPPPGSQVLETASHVVFHEIDPPGADAIAQDAVLADSQAGQLLGLEPLDGRKGVLRIVKDQAALDAALRPIGGPAGRAAWWSVRTRELFCRAGLLGDEKAHVELRSEVAREAVRRRFGYRPPFWVEAGVAHLVEAGVLNKGRLDLQHPAYADAARQAAGINMSFEVVRWWTVHESAGNPEREAVAWGFWFLLTEPGPAAKKWEGNLRDYLQRLRTSGNPAEATKLFPFDRDDEIVDEFRKRMRKLER